MQAVTIQRRMGKVIVGSFFCLVVGRRNLRNSHHRRYGNHRSRLHFQPAHWRGDWCSSWRRWVHRCGESRVLRAAAIVTILGLVITLTAPTSSVSIIGITIVGIGAPMVAPCVFNYRAAHQLRWERLRYRPTRRDRPASELFQLRRQYCWWSCHWNFGNGHQSACCPSTPLGVGCLLVPAGTGV